MKGKLIIFCAPSGTGKTTIIKDLMQRIPELAFSVSATSRQAREGELHGKDYYFLTAEEFKTKIKQDEFLEYEEVYTDQFYGTLNEEVRRLWNQGKHVIFDLDVLGGMNLKKQLQDRVLAIFVKPPSIDELKSRLIGRGTENEESLNKRLGRAEEELSKEKHFDITVVNDNLEKAQEEAYKIVSDFLTQE
ncbi:MAG: guanylate kinase [Bacteroidales bacterium]